LDRTGWAQLTPIRRKSLIQYLHALQHFLFKETRFRLVTLIIDHTCSPEDRQKMGQSLPTIIEDLMSKYYRQEFRAIQQQLTAELTEALENEFAFLFLIRDANALTT
jgi:hypothetical protein